MAEAQSYKMAIDLLCCHLGLTEEEAKLQLGIGQNNLCNNISLKLNKHSLCWV